MKPVTFFFNRTVQGMPYIRFESDHQYSHSHGWLTFVNSEGQTVIVNDSNIPYRVIDK